MAQSMTDRAIEQAQTLRASKAELLGRIGKNRELLRLLDANEELTQEQGAWLDSFYPVKTRNGSAEVAEVA